MNIECFVCDATFESKTSHLKFIGKDQWQELKLPESKEIDQIKENEANMPVEDAKLGGQRYGDNN